MSKDENLTFENLSDLCDRYIRDIEEVESVFKNQSSEMDRFFEIVGNNHKKVIYYLRLVIWYNYYSSYRFVH